MERQQVYFGRALSWSVPGLELVKEAVLADNANDLEKALGLYKRGLDHLVTGKLWAACGRKMPSAHPRVVWV